MPGVFQLEFFSFLWQITWVVNDKFYETKSHAFLTFQLHYVMLGLSLAFNYYLQLNILPKFILKSFSPQGSLYMLSLGCTD